MAKGVEGGVLMTGVESVVYKALEGNLAGIETPVSRKVTCQLEKKECLDRSKETRVLP